MVQVKALRAEIEAAADRTFTARITTAAVDREGEVLLPQGLHATDFEANPVVFWNHDYGLPIARCTQLRREPMAWQATATMAARPAEHQGDWLPETVHALMQQGVIRGVSVGFLPIESRIPTAKDRATFGPDVRRVHSKWKLLEFSITPLPANQEALVLAVSKGLMSAAQCRQWFGEMPQETPGVPVPGRTRSRRRIVVMMPPPATDGIADAVSVALGRAGALYL